MIDDSTQVAPLGSKSKFKEKAIWTKEETNALVDYLYQQSSQAGDGANFKTATFTAVANFIHPLLQQGPVKTAAMCKTKWSSVRILYYFFSDYHCMTI